MRHYDLDMHLKPLQTNNSGNLGWCSIKIRASNPTFVGPYKDHWSIGTVLIISVQYVTLNKRIKVMTNLQN